MAVRHPSGQDELAKRMDLVRSDDPRQAGMVSQGWTKMETKMFRRIWAKRHTNFANGYEFFVSGFVSFDSELQASESGLTRCRAAGWMHTKQSSPPKHIVHPCIPGYNNPDE
jgi:hypothetical protein